nr:unnamed protein product [Digitaria exilis]
MCKFGSLVERTAAVILHIHSVFPASPDAPVLYSNQFLDLWACGRALEPWNEKWQQIPLVLHDSDLTEAVQIKLPAAEEEEQVEAEDLTKTITKVLKNHPGPIERLRLDHSVCPGEGLLREWVEDLSCKGVWELVILNLTQPMEMEFPLHRLRSWSMTTLALGFFALDWQGAQTDDLPSLKQLHLAGCRFSGQALSAVVHRLPCLRILTIGGCHVTVGCGAQGLVIDSGTLTKLHLWHCTGSALTVANAPCLDVLVVGITPPAPPASGKEIVSTIDLNSVPALQKLHQLDLHSHNIRIANYGTRCGSSTKVKQRRVIALPSMSNLEVRVHVCMLHHASVLVDILCNLPRLEELVIERLDDLCAPEAAPERWLSSGVC